jgi:hypothetical protein
MNLFKLIEGIDNVLNMFNGDEENRLLLSVNMFEGGNVILLDIEMPSLSHPSTS